MATDYPGAAAPPDGVTADVNNPQDVLRTLNFVTQGLTLVIVSIFIALKLYAKIKVLGGKFGWEDCKLSCLITRRPVGEATD